MRREIFHFVVLIGVIIAICVVGRSDYNQEIIVGMSDGTYAALREELGDVSETKLVDAYLADKEHWDSVGFWK